MAVRHEHETWINTHMSKIRILVRLKEMMHECDRQGDARSNELRLQYIEDFTRTMADIENSLYLKLDDVGDGY
jgi:predicted metal-dependent hydrolase